VVIDKPAGIPVHAGGRYHQNSIVSILRLEHGLKEILPCNRLDRLTSGVMFLGMSGPTAAAMHDQLRERTVSKEYYCRVAGEFPEETITVDKAIRQVSRKHTLSRLVENDGKPSTTVFERVFYDQERNESVVLAKPLTGRTHQIRYCHWPLQGYGC
jgi:RluA family pseudouridine synthase